MTDNNTSRLSKKDYKRLMNEIHEAELQSYLKYKKQRLEKMNGSSETTKKERRKNRTERKINYLHGNGEKSWEPSSELIFEGNNLTVPLKKFRSESVAAAENGALLEAAHILALSHIFLVDKFHLDNCIAAHVPEIKDAIIRYAYMSNEIGRLDPKVVGWCKTAADAKEEGRPCDIRTPNTIIDSELHVWNILREVMPERPDGYHKNFFSRYLYPFVHEILMEKSQVYDSSDDKGLFAMASRINGNDFKSFFIITETAKKDPECKKVKLLKHMKVSIDFQVKEGTHSPTSFGILVDGFNCELYQMKLAEDGIYLAIVVMKFRLIENPVIDAVMIPRIVEAFCYIKEELQNLELMNLRLALAAENDDADSDDDTKEEPTKRFVKPTYLTKFIK